MRSSHDAKRFRVRQVAEALPRGDAGLLHHVVGVVGRGQRGGGHPPGRTGVAVDQRAKRVHVTRPGPRHQLGGIRIEGGVAHGRRGQPSERQLGHGHDRQTTSWVHGLENLRPALMAAA